VELPWDHLVDWTENFCACGHTCALHVSCCSQKLNLLSALHLKLFCAVHQYSSKKSWRGNRTQNTTLQKKNSHMPDVQRAISIFPLLLNARDSVSTLQNLSLARSRLYSSDTTKLMARPAILSSRHNIKNTIQSHHFTLLNTTLLFQRREFQRKTTSTQTVTLSS